MRNFLPTLSCVFLMLCLSAYAQAQKTIVGTVISGGDKKPLPEAIVLLKGSNLATVADENGKFELNVPTNDGFLIFTYIGFQSKEVPVSAASFDVVLDEGIEMDNVVVIGSRNASRTRIESPVPVDIIPVRAVVNEVGQVDINQLLHYAAPSFNSTRQNVWDGADHIDPASLRGLGTDQVLVLINGKRRHQTAFINVVGTPSRGQAGTDMSSIPAYAIERIEILRDGASAQYGSDAIAGVINIVLRKETNRLTAAATSGVNQLGDGLTYAGSLNYGFKLGKKGYVNLSGEYKSRDAFNRAEPWSGPIFNAFGGDQYDEAGYNTGIMPGTGKTAKQLDDEKLAQLGLSRKDYSMRLGQSTQKSYGAMFNASLPITDKHEIYAFGGLNQKRGQGAGFYRFAEPFNDGRNVEAVYPNGFLPLINSTINDASGAVGLRGKLGTWNYDVSNVYGSNFFKYDVSNSLNASREAYRLAVPNSGLEPKTTFDCGTVGFTQNTTNIDFSHHNDNLFHGANFAVGGEYRTDRYIQTVGELDSYKLYESKNAAGVDTLQKNGGAQVFPGFRNAVDGQRSNLAVYGEMEADFTANLMIGLALRYEKYSDFGETQNYKLVGKYKFTNQFMLRGSASTGFRAPTVHQLYYTATSTSFTPQGVGYELGIFTNTSEPARVLGIPTLKQETSVNYSAGFAFKPNDAFEMTVDGYSIEIKDRIVLTGEFNTADTPTNAQDSTIKRLLAEVGAGRATFFTNAIDTRTIGLDVVASYHLKQMGHDFRLVLAANFNKNQVTSKAKTTALLQGKEDTYFSRENVSHIEEGAPNTKVTFSINWKHKKFWAMLRNVYFGTVAYRTPVETTALNTYTGKEETLDQVFAPKVVTDLTLGYQITKQLTLSVGASNLFNVYPDKQTHSANAFYGQFPYSIYVQQFGMTGAYYFARLVYDLHTGEK